MARRTSSTWSSPGAWTPGTSDKSCGTMWAGHQLPMLYMAYLLSQIEDYRVMFEEVDKRWRALQQHQPSNT